MADFGSIDEALEAMEAAIRGAMGTWGDGDGSLQGARQRGRM